MNLQKGSVFVRAMVWLGGLALRSQTPTGSISGAVTDAAGAVTGTVSTSRQL